MVFLQLFAIFFKIGLFSFGGGYATIPIIKEQIISSYNWLSAQEFNDLLAISQMTPGPIGINAATFVGMNVGGIPGAMAATLGVTLPAFIISSLLAFIYKKYKELYLTKGILAGLRPAVVALVTSAGIDILITALWNDNLKLSTLLNINVIALIMIVIGVVLIRKFKVNPLLIMVGSGVVGAVMHLLS